MEKYWIEREYVTEGWDDNKIDLFFDNIENHLRTPEMEDLVKYAMEGCFTNIWREMNWYRLCTDGKKQKLAHLDVHMFIADDRLRELVLRGDEQKRRKA